MFTRRLERRLATLGLVTPLAVAGCVITISGNGNDNGDDNPPPTAVFTIRLYNQSDTTLDPQFYFSADATTVDQLFVSENKFTSFGVGTLGVLERGDSDEFTVECSAAHLLGTAGGAFGDDVNNPTGNGRLIVLTQDLSVFCGDVVSFVFDGSDGAYTTTYTVDQN